MKEVFVISPETVSDAHPRRPLPVAVATLLSQVGTVARMGRPLLDGCSRHYTVRAQDRFAAKSVIVKWAKIRPSGSDRLRLAVAGVDMDKS